MAKSIHLAANTVGEQAFTSGTLYGYSVRETAAAVASVVLRHGTAATDPAVALVELAGDESRTDLIAALDLPNGLFVDREAGTTEIVLYTT